MTLEGVRIAARLVFVLALLAVWVQRRRVLAALRTFFLEPSSAFNLGALRVVLFSMLWYVGRGADAAWFAGLPASLRQLPPGWGWLNGELLFDPTLAGHAQDALLVMSVFAALGVFSRASAPIAALLSVYVLGMQNFFIKINHGNHAPVLCALVVAFSPCGDALSLDRLWKRWRGYAAPPLTTGYTLPVRCCWMLLGTVYLFPGLSKLWESGDLWLTGAKVKAEMYTKWAENSHFEPLARIDQYPWLLALLGLATLAFEIGFMFALFNRVTRVVAAFSAVGFHLGIAHFMGIRFHVYLPLVLLFDAPQLGQLVSARLPASFVSSLDARVAVLSARAAELRSRFFPAGQRAFPRRNPWPGASAGALLVCAQLVAGVVPIVSWPISIHPRFSNRTKVSTTVRRTRVVLEASSGKSTDLDARLDRLGGARFARLLLDLKRAATLDALHQQGRTIVALFRDAGVIVQPGDHVAVYRTSSKLFPLGEHKDYHQKLMQLYAITDDYTVELVN